MPDACPMCEVEGVLHTDARGCIELLRALLATARADAADARLMGYGEGYTAATHALDPGNCLTGGACPICEPEVQS